MTVMVLYIQSFLRRYFSLSRSPQDGGCHRYNPEVLFASALVSSVHSWPFTMDHQIRAKRGLHRTSVLANSLLILSHRPISTCVWFGTTVSVTLCLSLRGQGGAPATLLSGKEHTHTHIHKRVCGMERDGE